MNYRAEVLRTSPPLGEDQMKTKLSIAGLGIAGEAGEVVEVIKKILHHEVPLDETMRVRLLKEMGDVYWYLEFLGAALGIQTSTILQMNVDKLRARHPVGWSAKAQQAKADERQPDRA